MAAFGRVEEAIIGSLPLCGYPKIHPIIENDNPYGVISTPWLNMLPCFHLAPIKVVVYNHPHNETSSCGRLPAYMLSAVIRTEHSYSAMPLGGQQIHQRFVRLGPLVLKADPLKFPRPR